MLEMTKVRYVATHAARYCRVKPRTHEYASHIVPQTHVDVAHTIVKKHNLAARHPGHMKCSVHRGKDIVKTQCVQTVCRMCKIGIRKQDTLVFRECLSQGTRGFGERMVGKMSVNECMVLLGINGRAVVHAERFQIGAILQILRETLMLRAVHCIAKVFHRIPRDLMRDAANKLLWHEHAIQIHEQRRTTACLILRRDVLNDRS